MWTGKRECQFLIHGTHHFILNKLYVPLSPSNQELLQGGEKAFPRSTQLRAGFWLYTHPGL